MLNFELVQAPLAYGLAEGVDPHQAPFGTLMVAENCRWTRTGRLEKRFGMSTVSGPSAFVRLFVRGRQLGAIASDGTVSARQSSGSFQARTDPAPIVTVTRDVAWDTVRGTKGGDVGILSDGSRIYAWVDGTPNTGFYGGILYYRQVDANGDEIVGPTLVYDMSASGTNPHVRVIVSGTSFLILWTDGANLMWWNPASSGTLQTNVWNSLSYSPYDAVSLGSTFLVSYFNGTSVVVQSYTFGLPPTVGTTFTVATTTTVAHVALDAVVGEPVYIIYRSAGTGDVSYAIVNAALSTVLRGPTVLESATVSGGQIQVAMGRISSTSAMALWYVKGTGHETGNLAYKIVATVSPFEGGIHHASGVAPTSKPFQMGSRTYVFASNNAIDMGLTNGDSYLLDITSVKVLAVTTPPPYEAAHIDVLLGGQFKDNALSQVPSFGGSFFSVVPFVSSSVQFNARQGARIVSATPMTTTDTALRPVTLGNEVYFSGPSINVWDGDALTPAGFAMPPYIAQSSAAQTTGGGLAANTYFFNTYAERRNQAGVLHRGPTAIAKSFTTTGATSRLNLSLAPVWVGLSRVAGLYGADVLLPLYVSQPGQAILQRYTLDPVSNMVYDTYTIASDITTTVTTAPSVTAPAIYTASGELDDYQAPASLFLTEHQNRLWSVGPDGTTLWFSKDITVNPGVAPGFSPGLTITFAQPIVALASMDSGLLAFTATGLYLIQGDGPAPNGQGATYQAVKVQTDVGCTNPRSVVSMPDGIMFQSARGIYLVSRGLEVLFAGKTVQDRTRTATVTTAVLVGKRSEVRFSLSTGESAVYNYVEKQWTTYKYRSAGVYGVTVVDALIWNNAYTVLFSNGSVATESDTLYLDGTDWIPMTIETSWYNATGPLGYQSVRNFSAAGFSSTDHDLTVSVGFDNEPGFGQSYTWQSGTAVTAVGPLESLEVSIGTRRKCQAIRFKVEDNVPSGGQSTGTGQGPAFDMLGIEVGAKRGFRKKGAGLNA